MTHLPPPPATTAPVAAGAQDVAAMTALFGRVLEYDQIGADDDFYDLGGDSLSATQVLSVVAHTTGVELSFGDLTAAPTPRALAAKVATRR